MKLYSGGIVCILVWFQVASQLPHSVLVWIGVAVIVGGLYWAYRSRQLCPVGDGQEITPITRNTKLLRWIDPGKTWLYRSSGSQRGKDKRASRGGMPTPTSQPTGGATFSPKYVRVASALITHHIRNAAQVIAYCHILPDNERQKCLGDVVAKLRWVANVLIPNLLQGRLKPSDYSSRAHLIR